MGGILKCFSEYKYLNFGGPAMNGYDHTLINGRGASGNPVNRFERIKYERDQTDDDGAGCLIGTEYFKDASRSVISKNDSPDIPFKASLNIYRGCEHGCVYCFARPTHEYIGLSCGLDFESRIFVKQDAPRLLREELAHPRWKPQVIALSSITDCYQPIERKLEITRECLKVLLDFRNPVSVITKNKLITRDIDIFKQMHEYSGIEVNISLTTLDGDLARLMEPRASTPDYRLLAIHELSQAGIPVNVLIAPIVPGLTDHELPSLMMNARKAGAQSAGYIVLRLPYAVKDLFVQWLEDHFPDRKNKVINRIRSLRGGKLYDPTWGKRMSAEGVFADGYRKLFEMAIRKTGLNQKSSGLSVEFFRNAADTQMHLF
jgi:DNA repair photolyase